MNIPSFSSGTIETVSKLIGELYTGSQLNRILAEVGISQYDPGAPTTKWTRIAHAVERQQARQRDGRPLIKLLSVTFDPRNLLTVKTECDINAARDDVNAVMSLDGLFVSDDGKIRRVTKTNTISEARRRSEQFRAFLLERGAHQEVLKHCRPELLREDYYEAAFESIKGLAERLRLITGIDLDARKLAQAVFGGNDPRLKINQLQSVTDRNEQTGTQLLAEGVFSAFRNPASHETRLKWKISEQDALDIMGLVSLIHRRVDNAEHLQHLGL